MSLWNSLDTEGSSLPRPGFELCTCGTQFPITVQAEKSCSRWRTEPEHSVTHYTIFEI